MQKGIRAALSLAETSPLFRALREVARLGQALSELTHPSQIAQLGVQGSPAPGFGTFGQHGGIMASTSRGQWPVGVVVALLPGLSMWHLICSGLTTQVTQRA